MKYFKTALDKIGCEIKKDQNALIALNEEIPMTNCAMGVTN